MSSSTEPQAPPTRGRPQRHDDAQILTAALAAFADAGYEAMSIRSLGRDLGLSHGALNQRFGSKDRLFYAAVDHGFGSMAADLAGHLSDGAPSEDPTDVLRDGIRAFLLASSRHPELVRLMNTLGITDSERLGYVFDRFVEPLVTPLRQALVESEPTAHGQMTTRELFFLIAHGAAAPFTLRGLSDRFDATDGPLDPEPFADHMAEVLLRTLGR